MVFRSEEEQQAFIDEIRRYKIEHYYTDKQIMDAMKISKPTFIKYKRLMYAQNSEYLAERTKEEIEESITVTVSRLEWICKTAKSIAENAELDGDKIKALTLLADVAVAISKIDSQERDEVLKTYGKGVENANNSEVVATQHE